MYAVVSALSLYLGGFLLLLAPVEANLRMIAASCYLLFASIVGYCRYSTRTKLGIQRGDPVTDFLSALWFFPLCLAQLELEVELGPIDARTQDVELAETGKEM